MDACPWLVLSLLVQTSIFQRTDTNSSILRIRRDLANAVKTHKISSLPRTTAFRHGGRHRYISLQCSLQLSPAAQPASQELQPGAAYAVVDIGILVSRILFAN